VCIGKQDCQEKGTFWQKLFIFRPNRTKQKEWKSMFFIIIYLHINLPIFQTQCGWISFWIFWRKKKWYYFVKKIESVFPKCFGNWFISSNRQMVLKVLNLSIFWEDIFLFEMFFFYIYIYIWLGFSCLVMNRTNCSWRFCFSSKENCQDQLQNKEYLYDQTKRTFLTNFTRAKILKV